MFLVVFCERGPGAKVLITDSTPEFFASDAIVYCAPVAQHMTDLFKPVCAEVTFIPPLLSMNGLVLPQNDGCFEGLITDFTGEVSLVSVENHVADQSGSVGKGAEADVAAELIPTTGYSVNCL